MRIFVRCREEVEEGLLIKESYILISIRDPDKPKVRVKRNAMCKAVLSLAFHDAEPTEQFNLPPNIVLMSEQDADAIWQFVRRNEHSVSAVVVHCEQGMSRSPAVAAGLAIGLGFSAKRFRNRYQPNQYVLSLIKRQARKDSATC